MKKITLIYTLTFALSAGFFWGIQAADEVNLDDLLNSLETEEGGDAAPDSGETGTDEGGDPAVDEKDPPDDLLGEIDEPQVDPIPAASEVEEPVVEEPVVEEPVVEEPAEAAAVSEEAPVAKSAQKIAADAASLSAKELARRQLQEEEAKKQIEQASKLIEKNELDQAGSLLDDALNKMPIRPATKEYIAIANRFKSRIATVKAETYMKDFDGRWLRVISSANRSKADALLAQALEDTADYSNAKDLVRRLSKMKRKEIEDYDQTEEYISRDRIALQLIEEGKQLFELRDYDAATEKFDTVLFHDPYNRDAIRFMRKVAEKQHSFYELERQNTVARRMAQVTDTWNPDLGLKPVAPRTAPGEKAVIINELCNAVIAKMENFVIGELEFKGSSINDVIGHLVATSRSQDKTGEGINIVVDLRQVAGGGGGRGRGTAPPEEEFGFEDDFGLEGFGEEPATGGFDEREAPAAGGSGGAGRTINLSVRRVTMKRALDIITSTNNLKWRCEDGIIFIRDADHPDDLITKFYQVDAANFTARVESAGGGGIGSEDDFGDFGEDFGEPGAGGGGGQKNSARELFEQYGVKFPNGSSITYNDLIGNLVVVNTPDNMIQLEKILPLIDVVPNQIEIEARFVEVAQQDLEELGFEWKILDDYEIATKEGDGNPLLGSPRVQVDKKQSGLTSGNRFFNFDPQAVDVSPASPKVSPFGATFLGNILSVSGVLTNPELQFVLHALDQSGRTDLLSAPRVTTLNGVNAQIEVVTEIIYPTEFEIEDSDINFVGGGIGGGGGQAVLPPTVIPGGFETRETGVILNVTPQVGNDKYTINLTLIPEIAELVDWIQYGAETTLADGSTIVVNIPQPVFTSRNVTTSLIVWDGHTVVLGGLIREEMVTIDDKIPIIGDIPLLGRLFQNKGKRSQKRNLLIFVTARLVTPGGEPLHSRREDLISEAARIGAGLPGSP